MSSASDADDAAQLVLLYQAAASNAYWTSSALALLGYDYLLTLHREIRLVWMHKLSGATVLFLLNRYMIILLYAIDMITISPINPKTCPGTGRFITVLEILPYIIWAVFSSLRTYALSRRNIIIGVVVFVLSLVPAGVNAYFFSTLTFVNLPPPSNCTALSAISDRLSRDLTIVSRSSLMAADALAIIVTWASTYGIGKASRDVRLATSFGTLLLRDGTIYFVALLAMNVVHMTLNTVKPSSFFQQASYVTVVENPLISILISRFILNLRAVDHRGGGGVGGEHDDELHGVSTSTSPSFVQTLPSSHFALDTEGSAQGPGAGRRSGGGSRWRLKRPARARWRLDESTLHFASSIVDEFDGPLNYSFSTAWTEDSRTEDGAGSEELELAEQHGGAGPEKDRAREEVDDVAPSRKETLSGALESVAVLESQTGNGGVHGGVLDVVRSPSDARMSDF